MKIYIGPFLKWIGPYEIAEKILFWMNKDEDDRVHKFGTWLAGDQHSSLLTKFCNWAYSKRKRTVNVHIDNYDVWNMDSTLSLIILPMLKKLQVNKHGGPNVSDADVPEGLNLRSTEAPAKANEWDTDENWFKRWDWVMDELIWTFTQLQPETDWESQYWTGEHDIKFVEIDETYINPLNGKEEALSQMIYGPKNAAVWDKEGHVIHQKRIDNGLMLFGKYYQALWD